MLFPTFPDSASAEETTSKLSLAISPTLSLSLQDTVNLNVTPTQNGTFSSSTATLSISTNNETGYSLYMATSNGKNTLASQNPNTTDTISAISSDENGIPSADFPSNTWGYSLDEAAPTNTTTYQAVPTDNTTALTTTSTASNDSYNLTFGAKIDTSLSSGTYSNQVIVSAVANPKYVPTLQTFTVEQCQSQASNDNVTVVDARDGNNYTVRYINGACWMTQNLRLSSTTEDGSSRILTSEDSDVTSNWSFPTGSLTSGDSYTEARSLISDDPSYGGYYNFCAASAGDNCSDVDPSSPTDSICPAGWDLPTEDQLDAIINLVDDFSPVGGGRYIDGRRHNIVESGLWWSATATTYDNSFQSNLLYTELGNELMSNIEEKSHGLSIRCVQSNQ